VSIEGKKKKKTKEDDEDDLEKNQVIDMEVDQIINEMATAAQNDRDSMAKGEIAIAKITLLPKIRREMKKMVYHEPFITKKGLQVLAQWIERHEDGTFPCINILEGILDICDELPVSKDDLIETGKELCQGIKLVHDCTKSTQVKNKAYKIMERWSNLYNEINMDDNNLEARARGYEQFLRHKNIPHQKPPSPPKQPQNKVTDFEEVKVLPRRVNKSEIASRVSYLTQKKLGLDFIHRPVSEIQVEKKKSQSSMAPIMRSLVQVKRSNKKRG